MNNGVLRVCKELVGTSSVHEGNKGNSCFRLLSKKNGTMAVRACRSLCCRAFCAISGFGSHARETTLYDSTSNSIARAVFHFAACLSFVFVLRGHTSVLGATQALVLG